MSDSEHALEAAFIDVKNASEVIGLATAAAFGKWRDDKNILLTKTKRVDIRSGTDMPAILDWRKSKSRQQREINFVARAVDVIVPGQ
jgi:diacylglycerol kinase family enzyme